jgi:hypothetical protein
MVDIAVPGSPPTWPGPDQYIQDAINATGSGTAFKLLSGVHRMQSIKLRTGDTLELADGAILRGSQDISGLSWTSDSTEWWASISDITAMSTFNARDGYDVTEGSSSMYRQWPIIDGDPKPFRTLRSQMDATSCWYDPGANRLYIGVNPAGKTVELARIYIAIEAASSSVTGVNIFGDRANPGIIENYASGQSTSGAGIDLGRYNHSNITNAGWTMRDLEIRNFRGMCLSHGDNSTIERITLHHTGQLGLGGAWSEDIVFRYNCLYVNGIGGWSNGGEAGNTKWTHQRRGIVAGNYFDTVDPNDPTFDHPHQSSVGSAWWDVSNDGCRIFSNEFLDRAHITMRGAFWEISYSMKFYNNILYQTSWNAENASWMVGMAMNTSGAKPGSTHYDTVEIYDNIFYECAGGPKAAQEVSRGSGDFGLYLTDYLDVHDNVIQYRDSNVYERTTAHEQSGITGGTAAAWGTTFDWDYNLYCMDDPTSGHFRADPDFEYLGGGFGTGDWSDWTGFGFDANGVMVDHDGTAANDFNPYRGGAL